LIGQCKFDGNLFCFFLSPAKKKNPTHIAAHLQAPRADAQNQSLQKSCNFSNAPTDNCIFVVENKDSIGLNLRINGN